jgi:hypothetical protein
MQAPGQATRNEARRFVLAQLSTFLCSMLCSLAAQCHRPSAGSQTQATNMVDTRGLKGFRDILCGLSTDQDDFIDLLQRIRDEALSTLPGIRCALNDLGLDCETFLFRSVREAAWLGLAHLECFTGNQGTPAGMGDVCGAARTSFKITGLLRASISTLLDGFATSYARVQNKQRQTPRASMKLAPKHSSWSELFTARIPKAEYIQLCASLCPAGPGLKQRKSEAIAPTAVQARNQCRMSGAQPLSTQALHGQGQPQASRHLSATSDAQLFDASTSYSTTSPPLSTSMPPFKTQSIGAQVTNALIAKRKIVLPPNFA